MNPDLYIIDQAALIDHCAELRGAPWLALDTEFIREQTYYPQLCLIQLASPDRVVCIDPLALPSLDPLLDLLYDPAITKILHAAQQDLEIFFNLRNATPTPLFDTQLAALVLGQGNQIGYAALVQQMLGVELDKTHTRADWRHRPLPPEWLSYATNDVRYLPELYRRQRAALEARGWLEALAEDFQALADPERYRPNPEDCWRRVRDHNRLRGSQRVILRTLAAWREEQARAHDRPRRWILDDLVLLDLARRAPATLDELQRIRSLSPATLQKHGAVLLERIASARAELPAHWPATPRQPSLSPGQIVRLDEVLARLASRAHDLGIPPQALTDRRHVEQWLMGEETPLNHGWRAAVIGPELRAQCLSLFGSDSTSDPPERE